LLHLTIWHPESDGASESHLAEEKQQAVLAAYLAKTLDSSRYGAGMIMLYRIAPIPLQVAKRAVVRYF
jgi:hypothetical protein